MFLLRFLQTYSPDGSTIHAGRLQKVNAVITQKNKTMILVSPLFLQRKHSIVRKETIISFHTSVSYTKCQLVAISLTNA